MATINYNGMKLQSIDECKVFEEPREMLVWNTNYHGPVKKMVCAIIPYRSSGSVITTCEAFEYCAKIPEEQKPRMATNRELAKWLAQGNGELSQEGSSESSTSWEYKLGYMDKTVPEFIGVRKWDDTEWHEPDVEYMGIEVNDEK